MARASKSPPLEVVDGRLVPALRVVGLAESDQRLQLRRLVAYGAGERQRLLVVVGALFVAALHAVDVAEAGQCFPFGGLVGAYDLRARMRACL